MANLGETTPEMIWDELDTLCFAAFEKGHQIRFPGAPSMYMVYEECVKELLYRKKYWKNYEFIHKSAQSILEWSSRQKRD